MPVSSLKYVVVIPSGGGKTTLSEDPIFLDIDYFYNLRETQSTYDRIELELQERSISKKPIGLKYSTEFRHRIGRYRGEARCLLTHSIGMALQSNLVLLGAFVPERELHERSIDDRENLGKWFARMNAATVLEDCMRNGVLAFRYSRWSDLSDEIENLLLENKSSQKIRVSHLEKKVVVGDESGDDEKMLSELLTSAVGCAFET